MSRNNGPTSRVSGYCRHRPTNQAYCKIRNPDGSRQTVYLGKWKSAVSKREYARIVAENEVAASSGSVTRAAGPGMTVNEVAAAFLRFADKHYRRADGSRTNEPVEYRAVIKLIRLSHGHVPAAEFGPLALKAVRNAMIEKGWCRTRINQQVGRIRRMFKWALSEQLVPAEVMTGLQSVSGLQPGRTSARETEPIRPVDEATVEATLPHLSRHVAGLVRLQAATAMRPGEACSIRWCDIDRTGETPLYMPVQHKLAYRNEARIIPLGPKAMAVLFEFPTARPDDFIFSPAVNVEEFHETRSAARSTPRFRSHMMRNVRKRKRKPTRAAGSKYEVLAYGRSIAETVKRINELRAKLAGEGNFDPLPHWHPNQLRHTAATRLRNEYGLEAAQVILGHKRLTTTQIYAEKNLALAAELARKAG